VPRPDTEPEQAFGFAPARRFGFHFAVEATAGDRQEEDVKEDFLALPLRYFFVKNFSSSFFLSLSWS
jgi:hypothetical protein